MKLVKIKYIVGPQAGFEHVMKEQLALVLKKRGQIEIIRGSSGRKKSTEEGNEKSAEGLDTGEPEKE